MSEFDRFPPQPGRVSTSSSSSSSVPAMPAVGKRTLVETLSYSQHVDPNTPRTPEDELRPINWTTEVSRLQRVVRPGGPFTVYQVDVGDECPKAPDSVDAAPCDVRGKAHLGNPIVIDDNHRAMRQRCWGSWVVLARRVRDQGAGVIDAVNNFFAPQDDAQLRGSGIIVPKGVRASLDVLVLLQQLPHRGGKTVGELFGDGTALHGVALDGAGVQRAASGAADDSYQGIVAADAEVREALQGVQAAADGVRAAGRGMERVRAEVELKAAQKQLAEDEEAVRSGGDAKKDAKETSELMIRGAEQVLSLIEHGALKGPMLGTVSVLVSSMLMNGPLARAKEQLQVSRQRVDHAQGKVSENALAEADALGSESLHQLTGANEKLTAARSRRRSAYDVAGTHAGKLAGGEEGRTIAAAISAETLADEVHARALEICAKTEGAEPPFNELAAKGLGIAVYHEKWPALEFPNRIVDLVQCHEHFKRVAELWAARRASLQELRTAIMGVRPGDHVAAAP